MIAPKRRAKKTEVRAYFCSPRRKSNYPMTCTSLLGCSSKNSFPLNYHTFGESSNDVETPLLKVSQISPQKKDHPPSILPLFINGFGTLDFWNWFNSCYKRSLHCIIAIFFLLCAVTIKIWKYNETKAKDMTTILPIPLQLWYWGFHFNLNKSILRTLDYWHLVIDLKTPFIRKSTEEL